MSSVVETTTTLQQQSAQATRDLCEALGLVAVSPANLKYLALALTLVATEEVARGSDFADRVRATYGSLLPARSKPSAGSEKGGRSAGSKAWNVKLTPIGTVDESMLDPYGPPNPFALQQLYGDDQLVLALGRYSPAKLKESVAIVQQRFPGTKPKKLTKVEIIDYIVRTIATPK